MKKKTIRTVDDKAILVMVNVNPPSFFIKYLGFGREVTLQDTRENRSTLIITLAEVLVLATVLHPASFVALISIFHLASGEEAVKKLH